jgi:hypothetical protein
VEAQGKRKCLGSGHAALDATGLRVATWWFAYGKSQSDIAAELGLEERDLTGEPCAHWGRCTLAEDGSCVAASDEECQASLACRAEGHCTAREGLCVVSDAAACQASHACKVEGRCAFSGPVSNAVYGSRALTPFCTHQNIGALGLPPDLDSQIAFAEAASASHDESAAAVFEYAMHSGISELREAACKGAKLSSSLQPQASQSTHPDPYTRAACSSH